jgi:proteic killer suppression protein
MILRFRHRGLERLYESGSSRGLNAGHAKKIARILADLDETVCPQDMDKPGYRLHPLKGAMSGFWSITVQANWRITFRFDDNHTTDVDLIDYH